MNTPLLARDCLSLHQVRTAVAATSVDGRLYAVGGECETKFSHEGTLYLSSVEYYDPIQNSWAYVAEMKQPRSFAAVAVLDGKPALSLSHTHTYSLTLVTAECSSCADCCRATDVYSLFTLSTVPTYLPIS